MDTILDLAPTVLAWALAVVGGASVLTAGIAPLTETEWDDKLAGALSKVHGWLSSIALNPKK